MRRSHISRRWKDRQNDISFAAIHSNSCLYNESLFSEFSHSCGVITELYSGYIKNELTLAH